MKVSTKIKRKLFLTYRRFFSDKIRLEKETIVVSPSAWRIFSGGGYNEQYEIIKEDLSLIKKKDYNKIIAYIGNIEKKQIKELTNLKWLQILSHGINGYDDRSLYANDDVIVTVVKDVFDKPIAQYCIAGYYMLNSYALSRKVVKERTQNGSFKCIDNTTVFIFGLGNIGTTLAKMCKRMEWNVIGVKRNVPVDLPDYVDAVYTMDTVKEHLQEADYVVNLLPETAETKGVYDIDFFRGLKKDACFCNVGRGNAVVDEDINQALAEGMLRGGVLLDAATLVKHRDKRILTTDHYSWKSDENDEAFNRYFSMQLQLFLNGEIPENRILLK